MNENKKAVKQTILIRNDVVRDPKLSVNGFAFVLYLKYLYWKTGSKFEFEVFTTEVKDYLCISDNKTIKTIFKELYNLRYLLKEVEELKQNKPILLTLNKDKFLTSTSKEETEYFTQLPINVLYAMRDRKLDRKEVRILYYLKSYTNHTNSKKMYCYPGIETTMTRELNMSKNTIPKYTKQLEEKGILSIEKNAIHTSYQYDDEGKLLFNKYNNHYYLNYDRLETL
ncbi:hypothetical protein WGM54_14075 [Paenibacillus polymyxa]|uniref:hypothetical protein n=1 Tax=Paenibacillus polymyxa TaxID=1406 RepID=UPI00307FA3E8